MFAYIGCRTTEKRHARGKGIRVFSVDKETGDWSEIQTLKTMDNPSYQCFDQNKEYLYSVHGDFNQASAYKIAADGTIERISLIDLPEGKNPVFITVDKTNRYVLIATLQGGRVFSIKRNEDGTLGEIADVYFVNGIKEGSHSFPHQCIFDNTGKWLLVASQGRDQGYGQVQVLKFNLEDGSLKANDEYKARPGAEPRNMAIHPSNQYVYLINEKDNRMIYFGFDEKTGKLSGRQMITTLPESYVGAADCGASVLSEDGEFLMGSNRIHETVAMMKVNTKTGFITRLDNYPTLGKTPRFMGTAPDTDLLYVANEDTDNIIEFRINENTQRLEYTGRIINTESPVCITFK